MSRGGFSRKIDLSPDLLRHRAGCMDSDYAAGAGLPFEEAMSGNGSFVSIVQELAIERLRQDTKCGQQDHDPSQYIHILNEEFTECQLEITRTINDYVFRPVGHPVSLQIIGKLRAELIQQCAVGIAMIQSIDRGLAGKRWEPTTSASRRCEFCLTEVFEADMKEVADPGFVKPVWVCKLHHDSSVKLAMLEVVRG